MGGFSPIRVVVAFCIVAAAAFFRLTSAEEDPCGFPHATQLATNASTFDPLKWVDYGADQVTIVNDTLAITASSSGDGARIHSAKRYMYGRYEVTLKCPEGDFSGLVPSFHATSHEGELRHQDEVDVEFLYRGPMSVWLQGNYFVDGKGGHEFLHRLPWDCSAAWHKYGFSWSRQNITWFIDDQVINVNYSKPHDPLPKMASWLMVSLWDASNESAGVWAGRFRARTPTDPALSYSIRDVLVDEYPLTPATTQLPVSGKNPIHRGTGFLVTLIGGIILCIGMV